MTVSGVILAAGRSSRLGRPKQLLPLAGEPLLNHTLRHAAASGLDELVLVLGNAAASIAAAITDVGQRTVVNPDFAAGQSTSLRAGLAAVRPDAAAVLFLLSDQPTVTPSIIDAVIGAFATTRAPIIVPTYDGARGQPVLFARSLFPALAAVSGDEGARGVIRANAALVHTVSIPGLPLPPDVDTEDDYARLQAVWPTLVRPS